ncbi:hypothetical protein RRG08_060169 [Elysia crispata]|uniref:Uncharacterized protein n=1 Tax=Elysia crispata TaxID=231223 RepID=A0AAE1DQQ6_9GAST|nr:hypothetical protein RRG08_060169 [Elysia crispata]
MKAAKEMDNDRAGALQEINIDIAEKLGPRSGGMRFNRNWNPLFPIARKRLTIREKMVVIAADRHFSSIVCRDQGEDCRDSS